MPCGNKVYVSLSNGEKVCQSYISIVVSVFGGLNCFALTKHRNVFIKGVSDASQTLSLCSYFF